MSAGRASGPAPDFGAHPGLQWLAGTDEGARWLEGLSGIVERSAARWQLTIGTPYPYAFTSLALPVTRPDGSEAVLKVQFPGSESEHEAAALVAWNGRGAVRLLAWDGELRALLLERCRPGTPLSAAGQDRALALFLGLLPRLSVATDGPFRSVAEEAELWRHSLRANWERWGRPFERSLLDAGLELLARLGPTQGEQVLVNQDLHADNVLRAEREPWLVIDPKPLTGEREFAAAPIVRGAELGHCRQAVVHRLDVLTRGLDLDRDRARGWSVVQTLAWAFGSDGVLTGHLDVARWLLDDR